MNILPMTPISLAHEERIHAASPGLNVMRPESDNVRNQLIPEAEIMLGTFDLRLCREAKRLQWVQTAAAGVDHIMPPEFVDNDVILTNAKGTIGIHLAEHAMGLLLGLTRGIVAQARTNLWNTDRWFGKVYDIYELSLGIVGLGDTGRQLAMRAHAFGMRVTAVDPEDVPVPECVSSCGKMDRMEELLRESDVVAICAPLTDATRGMFDSRAFRAMKPSSILINVTRGEIVDQEALVDALSSGEIAGTGLDVTDPEPLPADHPLWGIEHVIITHHMAGISPRRADFLMDLFCENLGRFLSGRELLSVVDKKKGY